MTLTSVDPKLINGMTFVGSYHTHTRWRTHFSDKDVREFMEVTEIGLPGKKPRMTFRNSFSVLANCDGSMTWALVALGGDPNKTATTRKRDKDWSYDESPRSAPDFPGQDVRDWEQQWDSYIDNVLAGLAQRYRFCLYRRKAKTGSLTLLKYSTEIKQPPTFPPIK